LVEGDVADLGMQIDDVGPFASLGTVTSLSPAVAEVVTL
jgi:hypothetical protein